MRIKSNVPLEPVIPFLLMMLLFSMGTGCDDTPQLSNNRGPSHIDASGGAGIDDASATQRPVEAAASVSSSQESLGQVVDILDAPSERQGDVPDRGGFKLSETDSDSDSIPGSATETGSQDTVKRRANSIPRKKNLAEIRFKHKSFTFVRIRYSTFGYSRLGERWRIDYPDADLGLSMRVAEETTLDVDPNGVVLELTDPRLREYPFIYIVEPGDLHFKNEEVVALREYLLGGGFLMVDDFWGEREWGNLRNEMMRVFPDRDPAEIPLEHPVFQCLFEMEEKPQIPNVGLGIESEHNGITWERSDAKVPHYRGVFDDDGRLMAIFCHNTDLGDGWERCDVSAYYQTEFCEKRATPMGVNIVVYALTH